MHFFVKELPIRRLRMGIRYDDHHKLVGSIGLLGTNIFLPASPGKRSAVRRVDPHQHKDFLSLAIYGLAGISLSPLAI
jgi:hypothetical protein